MRDLLHVPGRPLLIGVVHLRPTPGAPRYGGSPASLLEEACADAEALRVGGADALIVENFGDAPFYGDAVPAETVAILARAVEAVHGVAPELPVGVNVLRNDARAGLGLCAATAASFLRVNVFVGAMVTDQGILEGRAAELTRERARLAPDAGILADVHVKHAVPLGQEPLEDAAEEAFRRGGADALILSGTRTGSPADPSDFARVRERLPEAPLLVGSGLDARNASAFRPLARGAIVGTSLKRGGRVEEPVEEERVRALRAVWSG